MLTKRPQTHTFILLRCLRYILFSACFYASLLCYTHETIAATIERIIGTFHIQHKMGECL